MPLFKSIVVWPRPDVQLGNADNSSEDTHGSREAAEAVARRLRLHGFGGDGKIFPLSVRVEVVGSAYSELPQNREAYRLAEASIEFALQWSAMDWEPVDSRDRNRLCIEWAAEFQSELPDEPLDDWLDRADAFFDDAYQRWLTSTPPDMRQRIETDTALTRLLGSAADA